MDPIADMLTILKNGYAVRKETVSLPFSRMKYEILKILKSEGFIEEVKKRGKLPFQKGGPKRKIVVRLKYIHGIPVLKGAKRISTPSRHLYARSKDFLSSKKGGVIIVSTPKGLLTSDRAKKEKAGGELLCEVW